MDDVTREENLPWANTRVPSLLDTVFIRDDGRVEWWGVYALYLDGARRWARHELQLRKGRKGRWRTEIVDEWVDQATGVSHGTGQVLDTLYLEEV